MICFFFFRPRSTGKWAGPFLVAVELDGSSAVRSTRTVAMEGFPVLDVAAMLEDALALASILSELAAQCHPAQLDPFVILLACQPEVLGCEQVGISLVARGLTIMVKPDIRAAPWCSDIGHHAKLWTVKPRHWLAPRWLAHVGGGQFCNFMRCLHRVAVPPTP
jgi:hypothetical protein